jgi:bisphosphoglycerate-dependent phosphoglycerate mutase
VVVVVVVVVVVAHGRSCLGPQARVTRWLLTKLSFSTQNASKNAGEMISKYQILFNRTRQAVITGELVEIITGATASADM